MKKTIFQIPTRHSERTFYFRANGIGAKLCNNEISGVFFYANRTNSYGH